MQAAGVSDDRIPTHHNPAFHSAFSAMLSRADAIVYERTDAHQTITQLRRHGDSDENQTGDTLSSQPRSCLNATSVAARETPGTLVASLEREKGGQKGGQNSIRIF